MAFTCVSSSIWNLLSDAAERLRARGESLATLQIGFIPDYHYLVWFFFVFCFFLKKKKRSCFLTINLVYTMGLCSCYLIFTC